MEQDGLTWEPSSLILRSLMEIEIIEKRTVCDIRLKKGHFKLNLKWLLVKLQFHCQYVPSIRT